MAVAQGLSLAHRATRLRRVSANEFEQPTLTYGKLFILGTDGGEEFVMKKRRRANGFLFGEQTVVSGEVEAPSWPVTAKFRDHSNCLVVTRFDKDEDTDFFQVGRSTNEFVDFSIDERRLPHSRVSASRTSCLSRYACRIVVDRNPPHSARLYAAGFDKNSEISLENCRRTCASAEYLDSFSANGALVSFPTPSDSNEDRQWYEISIFGDLYERRPKHVTDKGEQHSTEGEGSISMLVRSDQENILLDGTLIDLCGVTLLYRSGRVLGDMMPGKVLKALQYVVTNCRPFCPVGFQSLDFQSDAQDGDPEQSHASWVVEHSTDSSTTTRRPYCFMGCGHVAGRAGFAPSASSVDGQERCSLCRKTSKVVPLKFGHEIAFYRGDDFPLCAFQCGHITTYSTAKYWGTLKHAHKHNRGRIYCPFCSAPLPRRMPFVRLILEIPDRPPSL